MPSFSRVPGNQVISNTTVVVNGTSLRVLLTGLKDSAGNDLVVTDDTEALSIFPEDGTAELQVYMIRVLQNVAATQSTVSATIMATGDLSKAPATSFKVEFRFKVEPAKELVVRDVTKQIFGVEQFNYITLAGPMVNMATFRHGDPNNAFGFIDTPGRLVHLRAFAAKFGDVERACWLMMPGNAKPASVMVVISHGFGQNHAYYSNLGYSNPLSKALLLDIRDRFILCRWGQQVMAARSNMALIMPVRARTGGSELGPFVTQQGIGGKIVADILVNADAAGALNDVNVVTFSSGIFDANAFIGIGGKGLKFGLTVNQDPALGAQILGSKRRQYLSGWTASGPRAGFEFLPKSRWQNDPKLAEMEKTLGREYLHTWALPNYTLAMALRS